MVLEEVADAPIPDTRSRPSAADATIQDIQAAVIAVFKHIEDNCAKGATEGLGFKEASALLVQAYRSAHRAQASLEPTWWEITNRYLKQLQTDTQRGSQTGVLQRIKDGCVLRRGTYRGRTALGRQWYLAHHLCVDAQDITRLVRARCREQKKRTFQRFNSLYPPAAKGHVRPAHPRVSSAPAEVREAHPSGRS